MESMPCEPNILIRENVRSEIELLTGSVAAAGCYFDAEVQKFLNTLPYTAIARTSSLIINQFNGMTFDQKSNNNYINSHVKMIGHLNGSGSNFSESSRES